MRTLASAGKVKALGMTNSQLYIGVKAANQNGVFPNAGGGDNFFVTVHGMRP